MDTGTSDRTDADPSRIALATEIAVAVGFAFLSRYLMSLFFWRYAGPVSLILTLVLLTLYLRTRGIRWTDLGLIPLHGWKARLAIIPKAGLTLLAFAAAVGLTAFVGPALGFEFLGKVPDGVEDRFGAVATSLAHYLLWLGIVWTAAAFGEEMFFRGYLVTRLGQVMPRGWIGSALAVLIAAALFGFGHYYYQGLRGAIVTGAIGIAFGTMFLVFRRNLWPMVLLHGLVDTLAFTGQYMGWE